MVQDCREINTYRCDITVLLVLLAGTRHRHEENKDPGNADLEPHLQVNWTNTRVQARAHEDIVNEVARHAYLVPGSDSEEIHAEGDTKANNHCDSHEMTKVVNDRA